MATKSTVGEKLAMLAKSKGKSQKGISSNLEMPVSQLNRFFRGHSDLSSNNLNVVLKELGIDLEEIISKKIREHAGIDELNLSSSEDCLIYLFRKLDPIGKQTCLNNLAWSNRIASDEKLPTQVESILKSEITLI
jgi:transcriptional regulator with XRE-family HTH domain